MCVVVCDCGALEWQDCAVLLTHPERCDACGECEELCPEGAVDCAFAIVWGEGQEPAEPTTPPGEGETNGGDRA